ncbi:MAG TPA: RtcB family protein, partial [Gemmataceae bacterium]|nr:RtcB family protein [Gemmataceae bacterium]
MAKESYRGPLEQVDPYCWRIPKEYRPGMRVDGLIFTSEALLSQVLKDQAPEQVANVAFLPGIQHASLAMPDIHWGYGFPIGGVCATDPDEGGVISPGGVGYDINCLTYDALVLNRHGYSRRIGELADDWRGAELACYRLAEGRRETTAACRWFGQRPRAKVLRAVTEAGDEVRATADHPFWTPAGMVPLGCLRPGDRVAFAPFRGVPYEMPCDDVIVSEAEVVAKWSALGKRSGGNGLKQVLTFLKARGLLPLRYSSAALPYLCKLLGFVMGDGNVHFVSGTGKGVVHFSGPAEELEAVRADLKQLGITPSRVYRRDRHHSIPTVYGACQFERTEEWFKVVGSGFALMLACLGCPVGKKPEQDYSAPAWLEAAPRWQKRLFLAAFFGAELTTPATVTGHETVFGAPTLGMNKRADRVASGRLFLGRISAWLKELGVETQSLLHEAGQTVEGKEYSDRLRLVLASASPNLINLWTRVGYEYNRARAGQAALAVQYLKHKENWLAERKAVAETAVALARQGTPRREIMRRLVGGSINQRFVERALYSKRAFTPRVGDHFPRFEQFCAEAGAGLARDGMVWERLAAVEAVDDYDGEVYDFTVNHPDHNFIANGFVVSNCGVRLVRSNLFYREVKPHLRELIDSLFRNVPSGVGRSGHYKFDRKELDRLLAEGSRYLLGRGFATPGDIDHTEAEGRLDGADPDAVSDLAKNRGAQQCGTLGSGNHFLEVQIVDHVFDEEAAATMGLEKDMVCVMIHSGSRGLGYQVCDDALAQLRRAPEKYGISLPDRQLACAPVDSP